MESLKLRKLRELGVARMGSYLDSLKTTSPLDFPLDILTEPSLSDAVSDVEVDPIYFPKTGMKWQVTSMTCFDRQTCRM